MPTLWKFLFEFWKNNLRDLTALSVVSHPPFFSRDLCLNSYFAGNIQSCLPDLLQPLQTKQIPSRRSRTGRNYPLPQTSHPDVLSSSSIRLADPLRSCSSWQIVPDTTLATSRLAYVSSAIGRPLFPSQRSRIYSILAAR